MALIEGFRVQNYRALRDVTLGRLSNQQDGEPLTSTAIKKAGWPLLGQIKHEWAERIGPRMALDRNASPSFCKFRDGLRSLAA